MLGKDLHYAHVVSAIILNNMSRYFIRQWNKMHPDQQWNSERKSGANLVTAIPSAERENIIFLQQRANLQLGDERKWDLDTWRYILLDSALGMCDHSVRGDIEFLLKTVVSLSTHASSESQSFSSDEQVIRDVVKSLTNISGKDMEQEFHDNLEWRMKMSIENAPFNKDGTKTLSGKSYVLFQGFFYFTRICTEEALNGLFVKRSVILCNQIQTQLSSDFSITIAQLSSTK